MIFFQIGHMTSDNHVVWRLDEASLIPFARSDFHLVIVQSNNCISEIVDKLPVFGTLMF